MILLIPNEANVEETVVVEVIVDLIVVAIVNVVVAVVCIGVICSVGDGIDVEIIVNTIDFVDNRTRYLL